MIGFDGKMVMCGFVFNQVAGKFTLCQEGIGRDDDPVNIERIEQRGSYFYFIGLLGGIAVPLTQFADFFWV